MRMRPYLEALIASPEPRSAFCGFRRARGPNPGCDDRRQPRDRHGGSTSLSMGEATPPPFCAPRCPTRSLLARPERLERPRRWVETQLERCPRARTAPASARTRARSRCTTSLGGPRQNDLNANAAASARARLCSAIELTRWLHEQDRTLVDLRQALLAAAAGGRIFPLRHRWVHRLVAQDQTRQRTPRPPGPAPAEAEHHPGQQALGASTRPLSDEALDLRQRVAVGLLCSTDSRSRVLCCAVKM